MEEGIPFEVGYEKAKTEILEAIGRIGQKYSIPTSLLNIMLHELSVEAKLNTYELVISTFDISVPQTLKDAMNVPDKVIAMDEDSDEDKTD